MCLYNEWISTALLSLRACANLLAGRIFFGGDALPLLDAFPLDAKDIPQRSPTNLSHLDQQHNDGGVELTEARPAIDCPGEAQSEVDQGSEEVDWPANRPARPSQ
eukprot:scaffold2708_cov158-Ochromonas_danica.AAC.2